MTSGAQEQCKRESFKPAASWYHPGFLKFSQPVVKGQGRHIAQGAEQKRWIHGDRNLLLFAQNLDWALNPRLGRKQHGVPNFHGFWDGRVKYDVHIWKWWIREEKGRWENKKKVRAIKRSGARIWLWTSQHHIRGKQGSQIRPVDLGAWGEDEGFRQRHPFLDRGLRDIHRWQSTGNGEHFWPSSNHEWFQVWPWIANKRNVQFSLPGGHHWNSRVSDRKTAILTPRSSHW